MATLEDRIQNAFNETRILILGVEVLIGFGYRSMFAQGFDALPKTARNGMIVSLLLMLVAFALLTTPTAYHRIVNQGDNSARLHAVLTRLTALALFPFAVGLGVDLYVVGVKVAGPAAAWAGGLGIFALALAAWYGAEWIERMRLHKKSKAGDRAESSRRQATPLADRVRNVLTETRVVLPGAQALLGFQFLGILTASFESLPRHVQIVHLGSLAAVALATVCLMTPAAWHRIVEEGENTERFHTVASVFVLVSLSLLALGVTSGLYVVLMKVTGSETKSVATSAAALLVFYGLWFGYTAAARARR